MKRSKFISRLFIYAFCVLTAFSCSSKFELLLKSSDVRTKFDAAMELYNAKKYRKAAQLFESTSLYSSGYPVDDTVRFYWALANYQFKDFITAEGNFSGFLNLYPASPFAKDAKFLHLDCLYRNTYRWELDQTPSAMAIIQISEYMKENPGEHTEACKTMNDDLLNRMELKSFEAAKLYYRMEDYIASKTAFKNILKDNAENRYREDILYYIAKSSYKYASLSVAAKQRERYLDFVNDYFTFISEYPVSTYRKELDVLNAKVKKLLGNEDGQSLSKKEQRQQKKEEKKLEKAAIKKKIIN